MSLIFALLLLATFVVAVFVYGLVHRQIHIWLWDYIWHGRRARKHRSRSSPVHVMFCFVDHYEPFSDGAGEELATARVDRWLRDYPALGRYRDADGKPPLHSYFYPEEEYRPELMDKLAGLCRDGYGEIEIHLHHDNDTAEAFREKLVRFAGTLKNRHGMLSTQGGKTVFAFIHGNWALDNSRKDGRWCGINNELVVLREAGCYADFTLPSAPSDTQTQQINSIYYATDDPCCPKSHNRGTAVKVGGAASGDLLIFQGPLALHWRHRKFGIWPRIENGDMAVCDIPVEERVDMWVRQHIHVLGRPEWIFIKVHTHGAIEQNADFLFGGELERLFGYLTRKYNDGSSHVLHFVSAREAYNIVKAAEAGENGNPDRYRDYLLPRPF